MPPEETAKILITAGLTLLGGLILFTITQVVLKLVDPCIEFKKNIAKIGADLLYYDGPGPPSESDDPPEKAFRKHASSLEQYYNATLQYEYVGELLGMPPYKELRQASADLLALSSTEGVIRANRVRKSRLDQEQREIDKTKILTMGAGDYTTEEERIKSEQLECDNEHQTLVAQKKSCSETIRSHLKIRRVYNPAQ
jgi:hypothetical protein